MSTVRLEKIIVTNFCQVRNIVLAIKCFEIFFDVEFIHTIFEMLGLIKRKFCGSAHTTVWAKFMHGHLLSRYYYVLVYKNIFKYAVYVKGFETPSANFFFSKFQLPEHVSGHI
jgi:hypothetical protein